MNLLGSELRRLREREGHTLKVVCDKIGVTPPTLSRVENGERKASDELLDKLATQYHAELAHLKRLRQQDESLQQKTEIRLGVPHSSFAASALALLFEGMPQGIRLVSYLQPGDGEALVPAFYGPPDLSQERMEPPRPAGINRYPLKFGWQSREPGGVAQCHHLAAAGLYQLLKAGEIDAMLAVSEFAEHADLQQVAQTAHAMAVATFVLISKNSIERPKDATDDVLNDPIENGKLAWKQWIENSPKPVPCLYARATMAQYVIEQVIDSATPPPRLLKEEVAPANWSNFLSRLQSLAVGHHSIAFLGWEPHVSWLKHSLRSIQELRNWNCQTLFIRDLPAVRYGDRFAYVSMDLMIAREDKGRWLNSKHFADLLTALATSAHRLNAAGRNAAIIKDLAFYLDMTEEDFFKEKSRMHFGAEVYLEWYFDIANQLPMER